MLVLIFEITNQLASITTGLLKSFLTLSKDLTNVSIHKNLKQQ